MKKLLLYVILALICASSNTIYSQSPTDFQLPEPVMVELNRLGEAYQILDQFADDVWEGWDDYMSYPFLMTFQNGLRILIGHPAPPPEFVPFPDVKVRGLALHIDTTRLNNFPVKLPLRAGGGPIPLGMFNNKMVTVVDIRFTAPVSVQEESTGILKGENDILIFIHELMHCYQPKILRNQYGNLRINPDLNIALFSDIEGTALLKAYEQGTLNGSLPYLKDFCIARSYKIRDLSRSERNSYSCDEFREGEATYSEVVVLQSVREGFKSSLAASVDNGYTHFADPGEFLSRYSRNLKSSAINTLDIYDKNYWFGCFEALLLQRYYPGWQQELRNEVWLDQIIRKRVNITPEDSLNALERFREVYNIDSLRAKHGTVISERDDTYRMFQELEGRTYIINMKPISQYLSSLVDKTVKNYRLGLIYMYPDGIGDIKFDDVSVSFKPVPTEINQLYYVKVIDTESGRNKKAYKMEYESKDNDGYFYNATITTPLFTLKAPKIS
ncbi:MAG: hypothetical protein IQL11_11375, partial [Bacteroidales bacterium]|nr:hypothetical protein [Bacteroidales bacterium]